MPAQAIGRHWLRQAGSGPSQVQTEQEQEGARQLQACNLRTSAAAQQPCNKRKNWDRNTIGRAGTPGAGGAEVGRQEAGASLGLVRTWKAPPTTTTTTTTTTGFQPPATYCPATSHCLLIHCTANNITSETADALLCAVKPTFPAPLGLCSLSPSDQKQTSDLRIPIHHSFVPAIPGDTVGGQRSQCPRPSSCGSWIKAHLQS
ncbi:hypothetical protein CSOJ01_01640 [Colletotrichum sojae]|uniref:Uncharacterized protein n=1 Tax=Colletotrichum sojae TaxID=2175907 RepID=A0A8H6JU13_9PEZI|nr:hypothetical protein CSOJ01_01640 [Colletotrichum sojae]